MMDKVLIVAAGLTAMCLSCPAEAATTETNFQVKTTRDLVTLCATPASDPLATAAVNFCEGFAVGAYQYHVVAEAATKAKPLFCFPSPTPSRNEAIRQFIAWSDQHSDVLDRPAIEGMFTFLKDRYPCRS
jgi:Rap1a immunity proteins